MDHQVFRLIYCHLISEAVHSFPAAAERETVHLTSHLIPVSDILHGLIHRVIGRWRLTKTGQVTRLTPSSSDENPSLMSNRSIACMHGHNTLALITCWSCVPWIMLMNFQVLYVMTACIQHAVREVNIPLIYRAWNLGRKPHRIYLPISDPVQRYTWNQRQVNTAYLFI